MERQERDSDLLGGGGVCASEVVLNLSKVGVFVVINSFSCRLEIRSQFQVGLIFYKWLFNAGAGGYK